MRRMFSENQLKEIVNQGIQSGEINIQSKYLIANGYLYDTNEVYYIFNGLLVSTEVVLNHQDFRLYSIAVNSDKVYIDCQWNQELEEYECSLNNGEEIDSCVIELFDINTGEKIKVLEF